MEFKAAALGLAAWSLAVLGASGAAPSRDGARSVFLEDLTTTELKARIEAGADSALIFSGGVEQTGPHVALGKHNLRGRLYAEAIARQVGNTFVAPIVPFAPNAPGPGSMRGHAGTLSLEPATFAAVNEELARSLIDGGFRTVFLLGDHGDSQTPLGEVAERLEREFAPKGVHVIFVSDSYARARRQIDAEMMGEGVDAEGHGGLWDAAETMAADPKAVRPALFKSSPLRPDGRFMVGPEGFSGDPRPSTVALGRRFAGIRIALAVDEIRRDRSVLAAPPKPAE